MPVVVIRPPTRDERHRDRRLQAFVRRGFGAGAPRCTTQQHKTLIGKYQEIYYPWHPWYRRTVLIRGLLTRRDRVVFRCTVENDPCRKSLEVPHWMFDRAVCCGMQLVDIPILRVCQLLSLKAMLGHARVTTGDDLRQDRHGLPPPKGHVDAKTTPSSPRASTRPLSSTSSPTPMVNAPVANPTAHDSAAGKNAARTPRKTARVRRGKGGVR